MLNLFGPPQIDPDASVRIKEWATQWFQVQADETVLVSQLRCSEVGCPPLETVIAVLGPGGPRRQHKVFKPAHAVTQHDLIALAACGTHG